MRPPAADILLIHQSSNRIIEVTVKRPTSTQ